MAPCESSRKDTHGILLAIGGSNPVPTTGKLPEEAKKLEKK